MPFNIALAISGCPWIPADCFRCSTCALTNVLPRLTLDLVHGIRNMDTTKLSSKGQVVLPKSVRDQHGWGEGTEFVVESTAHGVKLALAAVADGIDIADALHVASTPGDARAFATFDRDLARRGKGRLSPIEVL